MIGKQLFAMCGRSAASVVVSEPRQGDWTAHRIRDAAAATAQQLRDCLPGSLIGIAASEVSGLLAALTAVDIADGQAVLAPPTNHNAFASHNGLSVAALITDGNGAGDLAVERYESSSEMPSVLPPNAVVLFTSGTSAPPKPVIHTWESLSSAIRSGTPYLRRRWLLAYHPRTFAGLQVILQSLLTEGTLHPAANSPDAFRRQLAERDIEYAPATPSFWRAMLMDADQAVHTGGLRQITLGGEIADQHLLDQLRLKFPRADIAHIYASTEMGVCFSVRDGKAGFPASWLNDAPSGCELRVSPDGELLIRSMRRMQRYLDPAQKAIDDQWFNTGDLVALAGDRALFQGRRGSAINVAGHKIQPRHIEEVIRPLPGVVDVLVYGLDSSLTGQMAAATVQIGVGCDEKQLRTNIVAACRKALPKHMIPAQVSLSRESIRNGDKVRRQP